MVGLDTHVPLPTLTGEACAWALSKAGYRRVPLSPRWVRMERAGTRGHIPLGGLLLHEMELRIILVVAGMREQEFLALVAQTEAFVRGQTA